jgi:hypothetical protein
MKLIKLHPSAGVAAFAVRVSGYCSPAFDQDDAQATGNLPLVPQSGNSV